ncbi:MAG: cation-translocating P-type ATPase, partial [Planctomycetaceae bacterium]|nr:cation-translocating P-type ATPase [Planctomycetaceae bacterium]
LATPLAVWTALSAAIRKQVLFRSGEAIERLATSSAVCIDKTGTLTTGKPRVTRFVPASRSDDTCFARQLAIVLADASRHPFSVAVAEYCRRSFEGSSCKSGIPRLAAAAGVIQTVPGSGLESRLEDGRLARLGSINFVTDGGECSLRISPAVINLKVDADQLGASIVAVGVDGCVLGAFLLLEELREDAGDSLQQCMEMGLPVSILTGDRNARANRLREELWQSISSKVDASIREELSAGLTVFGELSPEQKVSRLQSVQATHGGAVMIGDGINDAPALAVSHAAMALGCGADVSRESAQVCLLSDDLRRIPWAIGLAKKTRTIIRQNLMWAFGYNSVGVLLAAAGVLNPAVAAGLMIGSSLLVISNSMRLMRFGETDSGTPVERDDSWEPSVRPVATTGDADSSAIHEGNDGGSESTAGGHMSRELERVG